MDDTVTCLVRGSASKYPRGFIWLIPAWFVILSFAVVIVGTAASSTGKMPLWLGVTEIGGLFVAGCIACWALSTVRRHAFRADRDGIALGVRSTRKRPKLRQVYVSWPEVSRLQLLPRRYGVLLEINLSPAARIVYQPSPGMQVLLWLGALAMPLGFGRGTPALTVPLADPPRYQVKICDRTAAELKLELGPIKPDSVQLRVVARKGALRFSAPPPEHPYSRPPTPVG